MASKRIFDIVFKTSGTDKAKMAIGGLGSALKKVTKVGVLAGAGIAALSVKLAGDFSKNLREVSTLMDNTTEKSIRQMGRELRSLSQTSGLALSSLSKAKYDIVSAGFSGAAQSAQVLAASSQLAVGGVTSAASAADLLTTSLNAYGMDASQVNDISDTLFTTVRLGKTTMDELAGSLGKVLPIAKASGVSLSDVGAAMASLTAGGINTAESTTALRGAIIALTAPTDVAAKSMKTAGIEAKRFDDGSFDLLSTIKQFEGMDPAALRKFIPDISASVAVSALANNVEGLSDNLLAFEDRAGASETAFNKMAGEFNTQMAMLKNTSQSIMIEIGDVIIDAILPSVTQANEALAKMGEIGWDVVAKRIVDGSGHIRLILKDVMDIVGQEMYIGGQKALGFLPRWLGGISDKEMENNIAVAHEMISSSIRLMEVEIGALTKKLTAPAPVDEESWGAWQEDMNSMFADMDVGGELWTAPEEDIIEGVDNYSEALINARTQAEGLIAAEAMKQQATEDSLAATAKAAALNATSAEDAMERVVRAAYMEAVARQIAKIVSSVPFPFNIGLAAGAAGIMSGLFDGAVGMAKKMKFAQFGMNEMISQPTLIMAGEAGPERVSITPASRPSSEQGGGGMTINFLGPVTNKEFVRDTIIPEINRVQSLGLA
jgi:TP901 family phage tail tape measure protein